MIYGLEGRKPGLFSRGRGGEQIHLSSGQLSPWSLSRGRSVKSLRWFSQLGLVDRIPVKCSSHRTTVLDRRLSHSQRPRSQTAGQSPSGYHEPSHMSHTLSFILTPISTHPWVRPPSALPPGFPRFVSWSGKPAKCPHFLLPQLFVTTHLCGRKW